MNNDLIVYLIYVAICLALIFLLEARIRKILKIVILYGSDLLIIMQSLAQIMRHLRMVNEDKKISEEEGWRRDPNLKPEKEKNYWRAYSECDHFSIDELKSEVEFELNLNEKKWDIAGIIYSIPAYTYSLKFENP